MGSAELTKKIKKPKERTGIIRDFDNKTTSVKAGICAVYVICIFLVVLCLFPIVWVTLAGFKNLRELVGSTAILPASINFQPYITTWIQLNIVQNYLNSLYSVAGSVVCALIFNGTLAYGLAILKPRGYKMISRLVMMSLLTPATISLVPLFMNINNLGLSGFFTPIWLAAGANAFFVVLFRQFFQSLPYSIIEASRIDGCSPFQTFFRIVMPLSRPIVVVIIIYAINGAWSDFLLPYLILSNTQWETVMVRLFVFSTQQVVTLDNLLRAVVFSMIPPIIIFFFFQKQLTENIVSVGIKG